MVNEYERKLANKRAKSDIKKALKEWHNTCLGIDTILIRMGYIKNPYSMYEYSKRVYTGMEIFTVYLNTYKLIICNEENIEYEIKQ